MLADDGKHLAVAPVHHVPLPFHRMVRVGTRLRLWYRLRKLDVGSNVIIDPENVQPASDPRTQVGPLWVVQRWIEVFEVFLINMMEGRSHRNKVNLFELAIDPFQFIVIQDLDRNHGTLRVTDDGQRWIAGQRFAIVFQNSFDSTVDSVTSRLVQFAAVESHLVDIKILANATNSVSFRGTAKVKVIRNIQNNIQDWSHHVQRQQQYAADRYQETDRILVGFDQETTESVMGMAVARILVHANVKHQYHTDKRA